MRPVKAATLLARLADAGYRLAEARKLTRVFISRVVHHPRDRDGRIDEPRDAGRAGGHEQQLRRVWLDRKVPPHRVELKLREAAAAAAAKQAKRKRRRP